MRIAFHGNLLPFGDSDPRAQTANQLPKQQEPGTGVRRNAAVRRRRRNL
jgi:hypothetical protein